MTMVAVCTYAIRIRALHHAECPKNNSNFEINIRPARITTAAIYEFKIKSMPTKQSLLISLWAHPISLGLASRCGPAAQGALAVNSLICDRCKRHAASVALFLIWGGALCLCVFPFDYIVDLL